MDKKEKLQNANSGKENSTNKKSARHIIKIGFLSCLTLLFIFTGALGVYILRLNVWSSFDTDKLENVKQTLLIYDSEDTLTTSLYSSQNRINIPLSDVPKYVINAFISTEDTRFYQHTGLDIQRILGALISDIKSGSLKEGASTISMQLIKNTHLSNEKAWSRKIEEAILTLKLESTFSKDEILEYYLNTIYFGKGAYGIETAAQTYFGISAKDLTLAQGALLAGVIKSPAKYAPHLHLDASKSRRDLVINLMVQNGYISDAEANTAKKETVTLVEKDTNKLIDYGYFTDNVMIEARNVLGIDQETLLSSGYRIYTTMDIKLQETCDELYTDNTLFPKSTSDIAPQSAMVVLDSKTSEIKAIIGGREYTTRFGLNRATQVKRQPGSAIKPILVYAPALNTGNYTAASVFNDEQTNFNGYTPKNSGDVYHGNVTLRESLAHSYNIPAVLLMQKLGVNYCKSFAQSLGISFEESDNNLALALGGFTTGVTPLELANAYAAFANGGVYTASTAIRRIEDSEGNIVYQSNPEQTRVMDEQNAYILTNMLQSVIDDGTGKKLALESIELAGKTGTVSIGKGTGNRDLWMAAYNSDYTSVVWMGYDSTDSTHCFASSVTGGSYPALLLKNLFNNIYADTVSPVFEQPSGVELVNLDKTELLNTGIVKLATAYTAASDVLAEYFTASTAPSDTNGYYTPDPPSDLILSRNESNQATITFTPLDKAITYKVYKQMPLSDEKIEVATVSGIDQKIMVTDTGTDTVKTTYYFVIPQASDSDGKEYIGATSKYLIYDPNSSVDSNTQASSLPTSTLLKSSATPTSTKNSANDKITASPTPSPTNRPAFIR